MNKLVKGSIAGAAGIALLLGGAGTLALWNANATTSIGSVTSGVLTLQSAADGAWANKPALWVPGNSATYTESFTVTATGDTIKATLTAATASKTDKGFTVTPSFVVTNVATGAPVTPSGGIYTLPSAGTYKVAATVNVVFDANNQDNQNATATFVDVIAISLNQI